MVLDILIILLIAFGFYSGYNKGIIKTLFSFVSIIISIAAAIKLSPVLADILVNTFSMKGNVALIVALILTFFLFLIFIRFIGNRIEALLSALQINFVNKLAGGVVMAIIYGIMVSMITGLVKDLEIVDQTVFTESATYPVIEPLSSQAMQIAQKIQPEMKKYWTNMLDGMDQLKEKSEPLLNDEN